LHLIVSSCALLYQLPIRAEFVVLVLDAEFVSVACVGGARIPVFGAVVNRGREHPVITETGRVHKMKPVLPNASIMWMARLSTWLKGH